MAALCHGAPAVSNLVFQYSEAGLPVDAKLQNFSQALFAPAVTDLLVFINTAGDNTAREDFLLR